MTDNAENGSLNRCGRIQEIFFKREKSNHQCRWLLWFVQWYKWKIIVQNMCFSIVNSIKCSNFYLCARSRASTVSRRLRNWRLSTCCHLRISMWQLSPGSKANIFGSAWRVKWENDLIRKAWTFMELSKSGGSCFKSPLYFCACACVGLKQPMPELILHVDSLDIFPISWCETNGYPLVYPIKPSGTRTGLMLTSDWRLVQHDAFWCSDPVSRLIAEIRSVTAD